MISLHSKFLNNFYTRANLYTHTHTLIIKIIGTCSIYRFQVKQNEETKKSYIDALKSQK